MLAVMTYNTGVFFAIVSGLCLGYYLFCLNGLGFIKKPKPAKIHKEDEDDYKICDNEELQLCH